MRANGWEWSTSCLIAVTKLLLWDKPGDETVSGHSLEILHHLQRFIKDGYETLSPVMDALLLCPMDLAGSGLFLKGQS